jgi:hypothetical protein
MMRYQLETEFPHILVELNCSGKYEVSFGDFEGTDEDWTPTLAEFLYKSMALEYAYDKFKNIEMEDKELIILDKSIPIAEMDMFIPGEEEKLEALIQMEIDNGN